MKSLNYVCAFNYITFASIIFLTNPLFPLLIAVEFQHYIIASKSLRKVNCLILKYLYMAMVISLNIFDYSLLFFWTCSSQKIITSLILYVISKVKS